MQQDDQPSDLQVLFVEDEPDNRLVLLARFRDTLRCVAVASAAAALEVLATRPVAVVVSDQRMPSMTGIDLLEIVRERWPATRRILLTADTERASALDAINRGGVHAYLEKPWDPSALSALLRVSVAEVETERASVALRQALLERARLEAAEAMRRELLHDLAGAAGVADLGYDAVADVIVGLSDRMSPAERADAEEGLAALRQGLDYIGRMQAELRSAARDDRVPRREPVAELVQIALRLCGAAQRADVDVDVGDGLAVWVDRVSGCRILANLLYNAFEAAEAQGGRAQVRVVAVAAPAQHGVGGRQGVVISVSDSGPGIAADARERVFERGFTTRSAGTGLGLALSRDLARREGGDLRLVTDETCSGSRFELWLPMAAT